MRLSILAVAAILISACGGGGGGGSSMIGGGGGGGGTPPGGLAVPAGLTITLITNVSAAARELVALPNGDLLVGTEGNTIVIVPGAESATVGTPHTFTTINDGPDAGIAYSPSQGLLFFGTRHGVYSVPYTSGDQTASTTPTQIASLRPSQVREDHITTSVAATSAKVYASIGSSSDNTWPEIDSTRATIQQMSGTGAGMSALAKQIRNAIALTIDPQTGALWAGGAGQDTLATGQPYEFIDAVTLQSGSPVSYGWPDCYDNQLYDSEPGPDANCSQIAIPRVIFPAYATVIGATFYPTNPSGTYALPAQYHGGLFVTLHGSWHTPNGCELAPEVVFVPMTGDSPQTAANWSAPTAQWQDFVTGFQPGCSDSTRIGRATGVAVGSQGSLFVADDLFGNIYRIR